mmetsp:Transcript_3983/g.9650  ORF Transcript_3983/g.9650 Transcript_3983/m.9650 type:complete len:204 (+) Transcript_3983:846-1457(+)
MMTCPDRSSTSPSLACKLATDLSCFIRLLSCAPTLASRGVAAIVSTTARLMMFTVSMVSNPALAARPKVTNANSPPGATYTPERSDVSSDRPKSFPHTAITPILYASSPSAHAQITPKFWNKQAGSICMPTVMKNKPRSRPRNGAMSDSTWRWNSVSASSRPARNAPSAMDSPRDWVSSDVPSAVNSVVAVITSALPSLAMRL